MGLALRDCNHLSLVDDGEARGMSLRDMCTLARGARRARGARERADDEEAAKALARFGTSEVGGESVSRFKSIVGDQVHVAALPMVTGRLLLATDQGDSVATAATTRPPASSGR